jgi:hypothetical protein
VSILGRDCPLVFVQLLTSENKFGLWAMLDYIQCAKWRGLSEPGQQGSRKKWCTSHRLLIMIASTASFAWSILCSLSIRCVDCIISNVKVGMVSISFHFFSHFLNSFDIESSWRETTKWTIYLCE